MGLNRIALSGIDEPGKTTMSIILKEYLELLGYVVKIVPFHKWVFADTLRRLFGHFIDRGRRDRRSQYKPPPKSLATKIKPPIAFLDNILF